MLKIKKNGQKAWVTFTLSSIEDINDVVISGEWNGWKDEPMKRKKSGDFYVTKVLRSGESFQFGYKVNGNNWIIDEECDSIDSPFLSQNSLLKL
ncbi:hypothetical protein GJV85_07430 [Sulfurimonas aquatica]|uniref:AMP-activated protein kinase glycogen-binding domain-containing protein n=1 Tax=Sulfurimonas aquatica TaxID=2672570 RepID=A0A975B0E9_9BACT|nr:hypothetical protein [Sulfurimonas aquatica]QSZ41944.1 hypothetical protein GJV85_07430 [Sulfurimonas aquatica]